jgi:hypothetical protein
MNSSSRPQLYSRPPPRRFRTCTAARFLSLPAPRGRFLEPHGRRRCIPFRRHQPLLFIVPKVLACPYRPAGFILPPHPSFRRAFQQCLERPLDLRPRFQLRDRPAGISRLPYHAARHFKLPETRAFRCSHALRRQQPMPHEYFFPEIRILPPPDIADSHLLSPALNPFLHGSSTSSSSTHMKSSSSSKSGGASPARFCTSCIK